MVNFMYQLSWATGSPAIWLNFILGVSASVFLIEVNISIKGADCSSLGGPNKVKD